MSVTRKLRKNIIGVDDIARLESEGKTWIEIAARANVSTTNLRLWLARNYNKIVRYEPK